MRPFGPSGIRSLRGCAGLLSAVFLSAACAHGSAPAREDAGRRAAATPEGQVRFTGRVTLDAFDPDAIRFGWQGSGLVATVRGPRISGRLASEDGREIFFHVVVDGRVLTRASVTSRMGEEVVLAEGLSSGPHVFELYRDTESHQGATRFQGFTEGVVEQAPPASGRLLEVVGDSISAGFGNLGRETHSSRGDAGECTWSASTSSWAQTYAALAGRALGAEVSTIAMSGWGLYEGGDDDREHAIGKVYGRAYGAYVTGNWTFPRTPQAVVVQIGGNDIGPRGSPTFDRGLFVQAGLDLVSQIRAHAPEAWILVALGPWDEGEPGLALLRDAQQAIVDERTREGDPRIERIELPAQPPGPGGEIVTGCMWHPSAAHHQLMAEVLRERLHQRLGW